MRPTVTVNNMVIALTRSRLGRCIELGVAQGRVGLSANRPTYDKAFKAFDY